MIHPGVVRILRMWGINLDELGGVRCKKMMIYDSEGNITATIPFTLSDQDVAGEDMVCRLTRFSRRFF
jgi:hypothetical protein